MMILLMPMGVIWGPDVFTLRRRAEGWKGPVSLPRIMLLLRRCLVKRMPGELLKMGESSFLTTVGAANNGRIGLAHQFY